jgi:hypothetical protein
MAWYVLILYALPVDQIAMDFANLVLHLIFINSEIVLVVFILLKDDTFLIFYLLDEPKFK